MWSDPDDCLFDAPYWVIAAEFGFWLLPVVTVMVWPHPAALVTILPFLFFSMWVATTNPKRAK